MSPPVHFGAYLSPIHEVPSLEEEESVDTYNQEAMEPLTFLPEVDSVPLTPASREALRHPPGPFQATPNAEDFAVLSGITSSDVYNTQNHKYARNRGWSGRFRGLLWSLGASALAAISGESSLGDDVDDPSNHSSSSAAAFAQWPSSENAEDQYQEVDDDWENLEENETSLAVGFPFGSSSLTFGSAEPQPLLWD